MIKDYLFGVGIEEILAHVASRSVKQLVDHASRFLKDNGLESKATRTFSTPRRLAASMQDLVERQTGIDEIKKGPVEKVTLDNEDNLTKATQGFIRS